MNRSSAFFRGLIIILGFLSLTGLVYALVVLGVTQPKMVAFIPLRALEESLLSGVGVGQLVVLIFFLVSLLQAIRFVKLAETVKTRWVVLIVVDVVSLLLVFVNVSSLSDIYKQYQAGLSQPEWALLFPGVGFQVLVAGALMALQISSAWIPKQVEMISRDINSYLIMQYVGLVCGLIGLVYVSLGFWYAHGWTLLVHTVMGSLAILVPYLLVVLLWVFTKLREGAGPWWDEKQAADLGKSALVTLAVSMMVMLCLFAITFQNLAGVMHLLWMPFYIFCVLTFFSGGILFYSSRG